MASIVYAENYKMVVAPTDEKAPKIVFDTRATQEVYFAGDDEEVTALDIEPSLLWLLNGSTNAQSTFFGLGAMKSTSGNIKYNTAFGVRALNRVANDGSAVDDGLYNTAVGYESMAATRSGSHNAALGTWALYNNVSGHGNTAIGHEAMYLTTRGDNNVCIGRYSGNSINKRSDLAEDYTGCFNVTIGVQAGYKLADGMNNVLIGTGTGYSWSEQTPIVSDNNLVLIGYGAGKNTVNTLQNSIAIGYLAKVSKSNQVVIGNNSVKETLVKGNLVVRGEDGIKRQIVFNPDGTCSWTAIE